MVTWWSGRYSSLTPRSQYSRSPSQFFLRLLQLSLVFSILFRVRQKHNIRTFTIILRTWNFSCCLHFNLWRKIFIWHKSWGWSSSFGNLCHILLSGLACGAGDSFLGSCHLIGHCGLVLEYYVSWLVIGYSCIDWKFIGMESTLLGRLMKLERKRTKQITKLK